MKQVNNSLLKKYISIMIFVLFFLLFPSVSQAVQEDSYDANYMSQIFSSISGFFQSLSNEVLDIAEMSVGDVSGADIVEITGVSSKGVRIQAENVYYVDNETASTDWSAAQNIDTPCTLAIAGTSAVAGDTVYLRGGTYVLPSISVGATDYWSIAFLPANSGSPGNPITFQAYQEEVVFFNNSANIGKLNPVSSYGTHFRDYIIFDGIDTSCAVAGGAGDDGHCKAVIIHQTTGTIVRNADIEAAVIDKNNAAIRVEDTIDCIIENNLLHGAHDPESPQYNAASIMIYDTYNLIVQNNDIWDCDTGIYDKQNGNYNHHRYNYLWDLSFGIYMGRKVYANGNTSIYQNVFNNIHGEFAISVNDVDTSGFDGLKIYSNTIYDSSRGIRLRNALIMSNASVFNNLIHTTITGMVSHDGATDYLDYNIYHNTGEWRHNGLWTGDVYTDLSSWQVTTGWDDHSITGDPQFINAGGSNPEDYKLQSGSPAITLGIDRQDYDNDGNTTERISAGAYITGNETIGYRATNEETNTCSQGLINSSECECTSQDSNLKIFYRGFCCNGTWFDDYAYTQCPAGNWYYVDQNHVSASDSNQGTENLPWEHAWYGAEQLQAGDVLWVKNGEYYRNTGNRIYPAIRPINNGTKDNPITIRAYPGHSPIAMGGPSLSTDPSEFTNPAIGARFTNYAIIDGFKVYGTGTLWGGDYGTIMNCELWAGHDTEFGCVLRIEKPTNCRIYNNILRDNEINGASEQNSVLLMEYDTTTCIIEHNEFRNSKSWGVYLKDDPENISVRYNYITNCSAGGIGGYANSDMGHNDSVYQNIIDVRHQGLFMNSWVTGIEIYNNVFFNSTTGPAFAHSDAQDISYYNNIVCTDSRFYHATTGLHYVNYMDYNNYYGSGDWANSWSSVASNLAGWKTYLSNNGYTFEQNSVDVNPLFVDPDNGDFHLQNNSPLRGAGKGGVDMGAYPTHDDEDCLIIGRESEGHVCGIEDTAPPSRTNPQPTGTLSAGTISTNISLTTDIQATCRYSNTSNTNYTDMTGTFTNTDSTTHSTEVSGLQTDNIYYIRCNSTNGYVNDADFNITFSVALMNVYLTSPINDYETPLDDITFICSANGSTIENITLYADISGWQANYINTTGSSISHAINNIPDGPHAWNCKACNNESNCSFAESNHTFTIDSTPPVLSNIQSAPSTTTATITWTTDENADSIVKYGTSSGVYTNSESSLSYVTGHSVGLSGLSMNTPHYYVVNSTDLSGNSIQGSEYGFTTANESGGLVLHLRFEEGSGTNAVDASGSGNNGELINANYTSDSQIGNYAMAFDGNGNWIQVPHSSSLDITGDQITLMAWIKINVDFANDYGVVVKNPDAGYNIVMTVQSTEAVSFRINTDSNYESLITASDVIHVGWWYHLAGVYNGTDMIIYINGESNASVPQWGNIESSTAPVLVGRRRIGDDRFFEGVIDEVKIYNRSLSAAEVMEQYSGTTSEEYHKADTNNDNQIDMPELMAFIARWKANATDVSKPEVEEARGIWFCGGGC